MSDDDIPKIAVDVSITDVEMVCDAFDSIGESLEDIADDVDPETRDALYNVIEDAYTYSEIIDDI